MEVGYCHLGHHRGWHHREYTWLRVPLQCLGGAHSTKPLATRNWEWQHGEMWPTAHMNLLQGTESIRVPRWAASDFLQDTWVSELLLPHPPFSLSFLSTLWAGGSPYLNSSHSPVSFTGFTNFPNIYGTFNPMLASTGRIIPKLLPVIMTNAKTGLSLFQN